ncbi:MAG: hypothetical protein WC044_06360 [Crocinitomicaceae bacterium]
MILGLAFPLAIIFPAIGLGGLNYWYWSKQGYKSWSFFVLGTIGIYGLLYQIVKPFV